MTLDDLISAIQKILPEASFGEDNDRQVIIYTDRQIDLDRKTLVPFNPEE